MKHWLFLAFLAPLPLAAAATCNDATYGIVPGKCAGFITTETTFRAIRAMPAPFTSRGIAEQDPQTGRYRCAVEIFSETPQVATLRFEGHDAFSYSAETASEQCGNADFGTATVSSFAIRLTEANKKAQWRLQNGLWLGMPIADLRVRVPSGLVLSGFGSGIWHNSVEVPKNLRLTFGVGEAAYPRLSDHEKTTLACRGKCLPLGLPLLEKAGLHLSGMEVTF